MKSQTDALDSPSTTPIAGNRDTATRLVGLLMPFISITSEKFFACSTQNDAKAVGIFRAAKNFLAHVSLDCKESQEHFCRVAAR